MERRERPKRVRSFLFGLVARPLMFAAWCFVLWGTLLAVLVAGKAAAEGPRQAFRALMGSGPEPLAWANGLAVVVALLVWATVLALRWVARRGDPGPESSDRG